MQASPFSGRVAGAEGSRAHILQAEEGRQPEDAGGGREVETAPLTHMIHGPPFFLNSLK